LGAFAGTYVSAGVILLASLLVGRALLLLLGRRHASFLEGAVGLSVLILVCTVAIRLPGDDATSIGCCVILLAASLLFLWWRPERTFGPAFGIALPVALLAGLAASFPFIASGQIGIPGIGLNNDIAMHLVDVDYLIDPSRPEPQSVINGYPLGPHSLVATVISVFATQPVYGWLGLLVAVPVLTAITSLGILRELPAGRRLLAAVLVSIAYLTASALGIAGFKELIAAMFVIAFAIGLREIEREPEGRIAIVIGLALITAAMVPVYSFPGGAWLAITAGLWILAQLLQIRAERGMEGARLVIRRSLPILIPALVVGLLAMLTQLDKMIDFFQSGSIGAVADTDSKLRDVVSPLETLGIWPSGDWLLGTHDVSDFWIFGAIGLAGLAYGLAWWIARRDYALPAAVLSGIAVYLATKYIRDGGLYILAKAVVVPASVVMLMTLTALLSRGGAWPKRIFAAVFVGLAAYSSFLALRDIVVAPDHRLNEMEAFQSDVSGQRVLALTSDRFADYGLRTAEVASPAFNAEIRVPSVGSKTQRLPIDFDSVPYEVLNQYPYAITTSAIYQSQAPPGWQLADETESYKLWERTGTTPRISSLAEEARPGRIYRCKSPKLSLFLDDGGELLTWQPRPVIAKRLYWRAGAPGDALPESRRIDNELAPAQATSQQIYLPPGRWELSLQYVTPVTGVTVRAPGLEVHLPAGMDAAIPYRPDQGPYWPVGEVTSTGEKITVSVQADDIDGYQKLLGVDAPAVIGNLTAVNRDGFLPVPNNSAACGLFADHLIGGKNPPRQIREVGEAPRKPGSGRNETAP
jgi:hypothetical protein